MESGWGWGRGAEDGAVLLRARDGKSEASLPPFGRGHAILKSPADQRTAKSGK